MKISKVKFDSLLFTVIVILNISFLFAVSLDVIFPFSREEQSIFLLFLNIIYILSKSRSEFPRLSFNQSPFSWCIIFSFMLLFVQLLCSFSVSDFNSFFLAVSLILLNISFLCIAGLEFKKKQKVSSITKPINYIAIYVIFVSIIVFCLLLLKILSIDKFAVDHTKYSLFEGNYNISQTEIFSPANMIFLLSTDRGIPFFGQFGIFTGICHEPHLSTLLVTPSLFFLLSMQKNKYFIIPFVFYSLLAASVTNLLLLPLCLCIYYIFFKLKSRVLYFKIFLVFFIVFIFYYFKNEIIQSLGLNLILLKTTSGNASFDTTTDILSYMYNPSSILGSGILIYSGNPKSTDIGAINFILNILFQISFIYGTIKMVLSKNNSIGVFSVGLIYFFLHSLKIGQMVYQFPFLIYILYLGHLTWLKNIKNENI
ncbi:MAG: hypothetical protein PHX08_06515 [Lachnospiraceae bacterium]|nr:hypothetical protein [Lachnospiraceae bacterium]